jgi:hypothetical protein
MPFQFLLTASRPVGNGIAGLPGWCASAAGYCSGSISYASLTMVDTGISDADIYRCVLDVLPIGVTAWVRLQS